MATLRSREFNANLMADIYGEEVGSDGIISEKGWDEISTLFGDIPEEDRASTFLAFIAVLDERGVDYSIKSMETMQ